MKAYLKIGIYQSVVPCDPNNELANRLGGFINGSDNDLRFHFKDSGEFEEDGIPIWVADSVEIVPPLNFWPLSRIK